MSDTEALRLFGEANDLWFNQGLTTQALARYQDALAKDPTDPVELYQYARVLRAFSRFDEARDVLAEAQQQSSRLGTLGQQLLARETHRQAHSRPFASPLPVQPSDLDVGLLEAKGLSPEQWLQVAVAAREREMFGLAAEAFGRGGSLHLRELDEDLREVEREAGKVLNWLNLMSAELGP
jgi:tetratricopeptide (TPR) repeat protein